MAEFKPVPPKNLEAAMKFVRDGGRLAIRTAWNAVIIDRKVINRFAKVGAVVLKEEGESYRYFSGNRSVYLLPGQLEFVVE